ncbi:MAG TPA: hypothetical protein VMU78_06550 [Methylocella sp.]|nr:hypothetical protein [Methylocella sp.]
MNINPNDIIGGITIRQLRRLLCSVGGGNTFSLNFISDHLNLPVQKSKALLQELLREGYVELADAPFKKPLYQRTLKGSALALANFKKRFSREIATGLIETVKKRTAALNADQWHPLYVDEIRIFGSWLRQQDNLGDIDLAVKLLRRYPNDFDSHILLTERLIERDHFRGTFFQRLCYDERSAYRQLKKGDWRISVQPFHVLEAIEVQGETIFKAETIARGNPKAMISKTVDPETLHANPQTASTASEQ